MLKALGTDIGTIHFVGIGGIGMSGIAEVMHQLGYKVQGSDVGDSYVVEKLRKEGIPVSIGHSADNLGDAAVVVSSTAIKEDNPEIAAAAGSKPEAYERRAVRLDGALHAGVPAYRRDALRAGHRIAGPAVVDQLDSTSLILPGQTAEVDRHGNLIIRLG